MLTFAIFRIDREIGKHSSSIVFSLTFSDSAGEITWNEIKRNPKLVFAGAMERNTQPKRFRKHLSEIIKYWNFGMLVTSYLVNASSQSYVITDCQNDLILALFSLLKNSQLAVSLVKLFHQHETHYFYLEIVHRWINYHII